MKALKEVMEMFSEYNEPVYDDYGNRHQTDIEIVEEIPQEKHTYLKGPQPMNPNNTLGSWYDLEILNPWVAVSATDYNAGAAGHRSYYCTLYIRNDATVQKIREWNSRQERAKKIITNSYSHVRNMKERLVCNKNRLLRLQQEAENLEFQIKNLEWYIDQYENKLTSFTDKIRSKTVENPMEFNRTSGSEGDIMV